MGLPLSEFRFIKLLFLLEFLGKWRLRVWKKTSDSKWQRAGSQNERCCFWYSDLGLSTQAQGKFSFYLYSNLRSDPSFDCQWVGVFQYNMVGFFIFFFKWLRTCESLFQYSQVSIVRSNPSQWKFEILWFLMFRWWC